MIATEIFVRFAFAGFYIFLFVVYHLAPQRVDSAFRPYVSCHLLLAVSYLWEMKLFVLGPRHHWPFAVERTYRRICGGGNGCGLLRVVCKPIVSWIRPFLLFGTLQWNVGFCVITSLRWGFAIVRSYGSNLWPISGVMGAGTQALMKNAYLMAPSFTHRYWHCVKKQVREALCLMMRCDSS